MLNWLPPPADFRGDLRAALGAEPGADRLARIAALAQHRLGYLETIQLDRAITWNAADPPADYTTVRLALLASATVDHLAPAIRVAGLRHRLLIDVYTGGYGQYRQELLDTTSALHRFRPQVVLFSLAARHAIGEISLAATADAVDGVLGAWVNDLRGLWQAARETLGATVIQQTFLNDAEPLFGSHDRLIPGAPARVIARLNERLGEAAAESSVALLDIARASERDGLDAWFDIIRWLQGKLEIAPQVAPLYGELVVRILAAQRGLSRKCLVLDLDNTLWGGVIGDDGVQGIVLGEGSGAGEAHLALQRYAKQLKERGVILALCSKNDPATAEAAFGSHPEMLLHWSDFAAHMVNWDDKAANLQRIAAQLNIGLDSLVFADDNPVERARIRQALPMIAVPELPADAAGFVRRLAEAGYFEAVAFTADDRERSGQYVANVSREALRQSSQNMEEFLRGLGMSVAFGRSRDVDLARVAQLINKTNQFNLTTRRYSLEEVSRLAANVASVVLHFRLRDRFGDNGLVSVVILRRNPGDRGVVDIDTWVMSCRVFGRQLEREILNITVETARGFGAHALRGEYLPTARNDVVRELYGSLGFHRLPDRDPEPSGSRWVLELATHVAQATHIAREAY
jgi:FkbH-like protein